MKHKMLLTTFATALAVGLSTVPIAAQAAPGKALVVSVTKGFRHDVIPVVDEVLTKLARESGKFSVDFVKSEEDMARLMTPQALAAYEVVIFNNTTGDLPLPDREGFLKWIREGHGFVGFHAATDTFPGFPAYIDMIGGQFLTHKEQVEVHCIVEDPKHPATRHLTTPVTVFDEIYLVKNFHREKVHGLLTLDKHPNDKIPGDYPIAWCKLYGQGRVFYTSLGHRHDVARREDIVKHYLGGILWAMGLEEGDATPPNKRLVLSAAEVNDGFRPLFNGTDLTGWKLRQADGKASWSAQNGMLVNSLGPDEHGTDLVSTDSFRDFVVRYEYMVPPGANSGFYLRGRHELQILDDFGSGQPSLSGNGSFYNLAAPAKFASRAPGEWQTVEIILKGNKVTVTMNGARIHNEQTLDRATGGELDRNIDAPGPILLQGDHGAVAFRNMRIRVLP